MSFNLVKVSRRSALMSTCKVSKRLATFSTAAVRRMTASRPSRFRLPSAPIPMAPTVIAAPSAAAMTSNTANESNLGVSSAYRGRRAGQINCALIGLGHEEASGLGDEGVSADPDLVMLSSEDLVRRTDGGWRCLSCSCWPTQSGALPSLARHFVVVAKPRWRRRRL